MDMAYINVSDDKLLPSIDTLEAMLKIAQECEDAIQLRLAEEQQISAIRSAPLSDEQMTKLYSFLTHCLMYCIFAEEWTQLDVNSPNYDLMRSYFELTENAMKMHRIQQQYKCADSFESSVMILFDSIIERYNREQNMHTRQYISSALFSVVSFVLPIGAAIPAPIAVLGIGLVRSQWLIGATQVMSNATRLGINTMGLSIDAFVWSINTTSKFLL